MAGNQDRQCPLKSLFERCAMSEHESASRELAKGAGRVAVHVVALVVGLILMVVGLAMGVSLVMLPIGIPVGLAGLFAFLWGIYGAPWTKG
jgi:hypothetical protein